MEVEVYPIYRSGSFDLITSPHLPSVQVRKGQKGQEPSVVLAPDGWIDLTLPEEQFNLKTALKILRRYGISPEDIQSIA